MTIWIDAQLSPALAQWIRTHFKGIEAVAVRQLGLRNAEDVEIFHAAGRAGATIKSKDADFVDLVNRLGT